MARCPTGGPFDSSNPALDRLLRLSGDSAAKMLGAGAPSRECRKQTARGRMSRCAQLGSPLPRVRYEGAGARQKVAGR